MRVVNPQHILLRPDGGEEGASVGSERDPLLFGSPGFTCSEEPAGKRWRQWRRMEPFLRDAITLTAGTHPFLPKHENVRGVRLSSTRSYASAYEFLRAWHGMMAWAGLADPLGKCG